MRIYGYTIPAGESRKISATGRYCRAVTGSARFGLRFDGGPLTEFESGLGVTLPGGFSQVEVENTAAASQFIELFISDSAVDDSRVIGTFTVSGAVESTNVAAVSHSVPAKQTISTSTQVLAADTDRLRALVELDSPCYVGSSSDGVTMPAGHFEWASQSALVLVPVSGSVNVRILEFSK